MFRHSGSRRKAAPVNGAMNGTWASAATGVAERDVGVPTSPISAKTPSESMSCCVLVTAASGSYESSRDTRSRRRPCTPPLRLASAKAASMPSRMFLPSSSAGPLKAADWPKSTESSKTPPARGVAAASPRGSATGLGCGGGAVRRGDRSALRGASRRHQREQGEHPERRWNTPAHRGDHSGRRVTRVRLFRPPSRR